LLTGVEIIAPDGAPDARTAARCVSGALQEGLLILAGGQNGNVISLSPPFDIRPEESEFLAASFERSLGRS
ncbi:MAG: diaminobutyrate--2-oxoglutarate transaminase, partial [Chthoniobacterales bacterium]